MATKAALKLADYVVTEAGFGADLGAEKFLDIKCRKAGLQPSAVVLVATIRALKYHGGVDRDALGEENLEALNKGIVNLERHLGNIQNHFGLPCVVAINHFTQDTDAEVDLLKGQVDALGAKAHIARHWAEGGAGAESLARELVETVAGDPPKLKFAYEDSASLWDKMSSVATKIYGAREIVAHAKIRAQIAALNDDYGHLPVCMAKTQMSFSTDPLLRGAPSDHVVEIREVKVANGAGFIVAICGDMMTMPGLPKVPAAERIDIDDNGKITGLF